VDSSVSALNLNIPDIVFEIDDPEAAVAGEDIIGETTLTARRIRLP